MKHYIELTLIPDLETPVYFLWQKVYQQVHLALVEVKNTDDKVPIGAAFPQYRQVTLGSKLRLIARSESELAALNLSHWLDRLTDYVHLTSIKTVPVSISEYACFFRINRRKANREKAQTTAERLGITFEAAMSRLEGRSEEQIQAPYIWLNSLSSRSQSGRPRQMKLVIGKKAKDQVDENCFEFNTYGLSSRCHVPLF